MGLGVQGWARLNREAVCLSRGAEADSRLDRHDTNHPTKGIKPTDHVRSCYPSSLHLLIHTTKRASDATDDDDRVNRTRKLVDTLDRRHVACDWPPIPPTPSLTSSFPPLSQIFAALHPDTRRHDCQSMALPHPSPDDPLMSATNRESVSSIQLALELEHQLDDHEHAHDQTPETMSSAVTAPTSVEDMPQEAYDPEVLTSIIIQLRASLATVTNERDEANEALADAGHKHASLEAKAADLEELLDTERKRAEKAEVERDQALKLAQENDEQVSNLAASDKRLYANVQPTQGEPLACQGGREPPRRNASPSRKSSHEHTNPQDRRPTPPRSQRHTLSGPVIGLPFSYVCQARLLPAPRWQCVALQSHCHTFLKAHGRWT